MVNLRKINSGRSHMPCGKPTLMALLFVVGWLSESNAQNTWVPGKYMDQAVLRVMSAVRSLSDDSQFGYDKGICIQAAYLKPSASVAFNRPFERGERYLVVGGGDEDAVDLDLTITDSEGRVVAKDEKTDAAPVVVFTAPRSGTYTLRQRLYQATRGSFCVVAVLREGGFDVPVKNLAVAATRLSALCQGVDKSTKARVGFHDLDNQWALYGSVLKASEETSITRINMGLGHRVVVAAGDNNATDLDLYLLDEDGLVIAKDEDPDANPVIQFQARQRPSHGLRIKNAGSRGATLALWATLRLEN